MKLIALLSFMCFTLAMEDISDRNQYLILENELEREAALVDTCRDFLIDTLLIELQGELQNEQSIVHEVENEKLRRIVNAIAERKQHWGQLPCHQFLDTFNVVDPTMPKPQLLTCFKTICDQYKRKEPFIDLVKEECMKEKPLSFTQLLEKKGRLQKINKLLFYIFY